MSYLDVVLPNAGVMFSPAVLAVAAIALLAYVVKVVFLPPKGPVLPFPVSTIKPGNLTDTILEARKKVHYPASLSATLHAPESLSSHLIDVVFSPSRLRLRRLCQD